MQPFARRVETYDFVGTKTGVRSSCCLEIRPSSVRLPGRLPLLAALVRLVDLGWILVRPASRTQYFKLVVEVTGKDLWY